MNLRAKSCSIILALILALSCSTKNRTERQPIKAPQQQSARQEEQETPRSIDSFDPTGLWFVDSPAQLCTATSTYSDGHRMFTEPFYCKALPLEDLIISRRIQVSYERETESVEIKDNELVRRINLFLDNTGQFMVGLGATPLAGASEKSLAPGCKLMIRSFNGALFQRGDNNSMVYNINFWLDFRPDQNVPDACKGTLKELKGQLVKGRADALYQFMYDLHAIDPTRVELLRNLSIIYMHEAIRSQEL